MSVGAPLAHAQALLLGGRCPACAELLGPRSLFGREPCSRCATAINANQRGTQLATRVRARGNKQLGLIALGVGVAHLLLGSVPLIGAAVLVLAAGWIRVGILQPVSALLSPRRRALTRWTARLVVALALVVTVIATEALTLIPVLGPIAKSVISAAEVAIAAWAVTRYAHWQLDREAAGEPIAGWELGLVIACAVALVAAVVALALAFVALLSMFDTMLGWLR